MHGDTVINTLTSALAIMIIQIIMEAMVATLDFHHLILIQASVDGQ